MERSQNKRIYCPARCPGCGDVVHLLVSNSGTVTVQMHNARGCNLTFHYRCWIEDGLPLPRVEFLDPKNAMHFTLHPHGEKPEPATNESPSPPPWRFPHLTKADRVRRSRGEDEQPRPSPKKAGRGAVQT